MTQIVLLIAVTITVLLVLARPDSSPAFEGNRASAKVTYIYDGDTLQINGSERVRIWGIDTPEKGENGADAARNALSRLVDGRTVDILKIDNDRYGRTVARVILKDGRDVSRVMIESGHAVEYCRYSKGYYGTC